MNRQVIEIFLILLILTIFFFVLLNPSLVISYLYQPKKCFSELSSLKKENAFLISQVNSLKKENKKIKSSKEILPLLKEKNIEVEPAKVVGLYPFNYQPWFVINLGREDGIKEGMPVVLAERRENFKALILVGEISKVGQKRAVVSSLYSRDFSASVYIPPLKEEEKSLVGVLKGDGDRIFVNFFSQKKKISLNERVFTTGFDQKFPPDLYVGKIVSSKEEDLFKKAEIEVPYQWGELGEVFVITDY